MGFLSAALSIAEKDIKIELRRTYEIISILTFSVSSVLVCSFTFGANLALTQEVASTALWIIIFFTGILTFTTSFTREMDRGTLGGLKTLPCSQLAILLGKTLYSILLLSLVGGVLLPLSVVFMGLKISDQFAGFLVVFLLGIIDLSIAGSLVSSLVMFSEGKNLVMSFLLFPVCMPVLISSVLATEKLMSALPFLDVVSELKLLLAFLLCITAIANFTFKFVLEE